MARNLRTSLISGGFGRVPGTRAAITPFGSAPMSQIAPLNPVVPPSPNVFTSTATTPITRVPVVATGVQLPPNPQNFTFGNPFNDAMREFASRFGTRFADEGGLEAGEADGEAGEDDSGDAD